MPIGHMVHFEPVWYSRKKHSSTEGPWINIFFFLYTVKTSKCKINIRRFEENARLLEVLWSVQKEKQKESTFYSFSSLSLSFIMYYIISLTVMSCDILLTSVHQ